MHKPHRTAYHTHIKILVSTNLIPDDIRRRIPRSNLHRWRREHQSKYKTFNTVRQSDKQYYRAGDHIYAIMRVCITLRQLIANTPQFRRTIRQYKKTVVMLITRVKTVLGLKKVISLFGISVNTFLNWKAQSFTECFESLTRQCKKIYPSQATRAEINTLKQLLDDQRFQHWPVSSIAWYALRNQILSFSINTWYKYINKLGLTRTTPHGRRKKNKTGIRATEPHKIWHADITIFETLDGVKHYIYLVADNYSRKILSYTIARKVRAHIRRSTVLHALTRELPEDRIDLITDSGPENNFAAIAKVNHIRAQIDIHYSNSVIEAHNKVLKYRYLYKNTIHNRDELEKLLPTFIDDYNNRPHISLNGLTPNEACAGTVLDRHLLSEYTNQSIKERTRNNKLNRCTQCK
jgi:putative transposase